MLFAGVVGTLPLAFRPTTIGSTWLLRDWTLLFASIEAFWTGTDVTRLFDAPRSPLHPHVGGAIRIAS
jgi:hypothetical protein